MLKIRLLCIVGSASASTLSFATITGAATKSYLLEEDSRYVSTSNFSKIITSKVVSSKMITSKV